LALGLASGLVYVFGTVFARPLDIVEGEILFEAQRVRDHLALYVDPVLGAYDYGAVPSRYHVLYTPVWPYVLALLPAPIAPTVARLVSGLAWFALLGAIVLSAPTGNRRAAIVAAAWAGGTFMLARHSGTATADGVAVVLAGIALLRSVRVGHADVVAGALFALAAWTKPNVLGLAAGVLLHEVVVGRARAWRPLAAALVVTALLGFWTHRVSHGAWLAHLTRSTLQPASAWRAVEQIAARLPFLGLPHAFAALSAWRARRSSTARLLFTALTTSLIWTAIEMGKVGSSTSYWLEPTVAAVTTMANVPVPALALWSSSWARLSLTAASVATLLLSAVASLQGARTAFVRRDAIGRVRAECGARASDLVMAEHPGLEMMLDGRVLETPYQLTHLVRKGHYPLALWESDIASPQVRCLVTESDSLERPPTAIDADNDRFGPEIRPALTARFQLVARDGGLWIYRARD
jgi:hypothetical protein